jgi:hypothetical protein
MIKAALKNLWLSEPQSKLPPSGPSLRE